MLMPAAPIYYSTSIYFAQCKTLDGAINNKRTSVVEIDRYIGENRFRGTVRRLCGNNRFVEQE